MTQQAHIKRFSILILIILVLLTLLPSTLYAQNPETITHVVQAGENLYRISLRYGVDMGELARANGITDTSRIFSGQVLIIPGLSTPDSSDIIENPLIAGTPTIHVVQPGENLTSIARLYDITLDLLMQSNNITNPNRIERGQELTIWTVTSVNEGVASAEPEANAPDEFIQGAPSTSAISYTVQAGESLSQIARRYGLDWTLLAQMNNIINPDTLYAGQVITIPGVNADGSIDDLGIITPPPVTTVSGVTIPTPTITVGRQVVVDLSDQMTYAFEDGILLRSSLVSTGLPATPTVLGDYQVWHRTPAQTMTGPGYNLPNVQWVQYFYQGYGLHGTYWHNNFGQPMSHGCVNMTNDDALWFYEFGYIGLPVHVQY